MSKEIIETLPKTDKIEIERTKTSEISETEIMNAITLKEM